MATSIEATSIEVFAALPLSWSVAPKSQSDRAARGVWINDDAALGDFDVTCGHQPTRSLSTALHLGVPGRFIEHTAGRFGWAHRGCRRARRQQLEDRRFHGPVEVRRARSPAALAAVA
jgi:hypothetical protein